MLDNVVSNKNMFSFGFSAKNRKIEERELSNNIPGTKEKGETWLKTRTGISSFKNFSSFSLKANNLGLSYDCR